MMNLFKSLLPGNYPGSDEAGEPSDAPLDRSTSSSHTASQAVEYETPLGDAGLETGVREEVILDHSMTHITIRLGQLEFLPEQGLKVCPVLAVDSLIS